MANKRRSMSTAAIIAFHQKQAELNMGKEIAARNRRVFHEETIVALGGEVGDYDVARKG